MKIKRSMPAFVIGLIINIFYIFYGFWIAIIGGFFGSLGGAISGEGGIVFEALIVILLGWLSIIGAIIGIIGSAKCLKKANTGGVLLLICTLMTGALSVYRIISALATQETFFISLIMLYIIPLVLNIVATTCAFTGKVQMEKNINSNSSDNNYQGTNGQSGNSNYGPYNQQFAPYNQNNNYGANGYHSQENNVKNQDADNQSNGSNQ